MAMQELALSEAQAIENVETQATQIKELEAQTEAQASETAEAQAHSEGGSDEESGGRAAKRLRPE